MNAPQPTSPRRRLEELLAIPDRERTDDQWDEINELEIRLAPGNREENAGQGARRNTPSGVGHPEPGGGTRGKKPFQKFHKKPVKRSTP